MSCVDADNVYRLDLFIDFFAISIVNVARLHLIYICIVWRSNPFLERGGGGGGGGWYYHDYDEMGEFMEGLSPRDRDSWLIEEWLALKEKTSNGMTWNKYVEEQNVQESSIILSFFKVREISQQNQANQANLEGVQNRALSESK